MLYAWLVTLQTVYNGCTCACTTFDALQADVKTLSVRLGVKKVFWACIVLLQIAYAGAIGLGALSQVSMQCVQACLASSVSPACPNFLGPATACE